MSFINLFLFFETGGRLFKDGDGDGNSGRAGRQAVSSEDYVRWREMKKGIVKMWKFGEGTRSMVRLIRLNFTL